LLIHGAPGGEDFLPDLNPPWRTGNLDGQSFERGLRFGNPVLCRGQPDDIDEAEKQAGCQTGSSPESRLFFLSPG
jgi:hypothetical protein